MKKTLIRNVQKIKKDNELESLEILISGKTIEMIEKSIVYDEKTMEILDGKNMLITPGFIDVHVHLREPGFEEKETIFSGTRAAALGGYTSIFAMPNTNPVIDEVKVMMGIKEKAKKDSLIRCEFYSAITKGEKGEDLVDFSAMKAAGASGFSDDGKGVQSAGRMYLAMMKVAELNSFITAHCEDESMLFGGYIHEGKYSKKYGYKGIHSLSEDLQIIRDAAISEATGCRYHICHMSTQTGVRALRRAKQDGVKISGEVTPHHLLLCEEDLKEHGDFKMNPPLRRKEDQESLIQALKDGTIEVIATDHAPHSHKEKDKGLANSAFGIVGLETAFSLLYTQLVKTGKITLEKLVDAMTVGPKKLLRVSYGELKVGLDADLTLINLEEEFRIDAKLFTSLGRNTPFQDELVQGKIDTVIFQGNRVVSQGKVLEPNQEEKVG
ncbi:MAG: dihydroorotase [Clostridium sp.]|nr:dihydroorotase [Clostridium sp.]